MYCPTCGGKNDDGSAHCATCGMNLMQNNAAEPAENVPSYLGWAIGATLIFWPLGIIAIYYALQSGNQLKRGDSEGALASYRKAKKWCFITIAAAFSMVVISTAVVFISAMLVGL